MRSRWVSPYFTQADSSKSFRCKFDKSVESSWPRIALSVREELFLANDFTKDQPKLGEILNRFVIKEASRKDMNILFQAQKATEP